MCHITEKTKAPFMHLTMAMSDRLENCLTGYVLLDLFKILSHRECKARALPQGTLWMAPQTHRNLQYCVQGFIQACFAKDPVGNPWQSHHRWTELPIELWFGRLRQRMPQATFNSKQYWAQAAKEMMREKKLGVGATDDSILDPPTDQEFFDASLRALKSAIKLAAWCGGVTEKSLHLAYTDQCATLTPTAEANRPYHEWERDPKEDWEDADEGPEDAKKKWTSLLEHVRNEAAASLQAEDDQSQKDAKNRDKQNDQCNAENIEQNQKDAENQEKENEQLPSPVDEWTAFAEIPDGHYLKDICEADDEDGEVVASEDEDRLLCNLRQALWSAKDTSSTEIFDRLWRLAMYLRHWRGGQDQFWLRNPRSSRKKASTIHWYRCLGSQKGSLENQIQLRPYALNMSQRFRKLQRCKSLSPSWFGLWFQDRCQVEWDETCWAASRNGGQHHQQSAFRTLGQMEEADGGSLCSQQCEGGNPRQAPEPWFESFQIRSCDCLFESFWWICDVRMWV